MDKKKQKFVSGQIARDKWSKDINTDDLLSIDDFNNVCGNVFKKAANITLDFSKRQTVIQASSIDNDDWKKKCEKIYIIVKDGKIIKIGGTRNGMKARFGSYLCGHHVVEREKSGKMSVTNAHLYHSIENDLLKSDSKWEFYTWTLPVLEQKITIFDIETKIIAQTYHVYESCCIKKHKEIIGKIPILCDKSDPTYK